MVIEPKTATAHFDNSNSNSGERERESDGEDERWSTGEQKRTG